MADAIVSVVLEQLASIAGQQIEQEVKLRAENALTLKKKVCSFFLSPCFSLRKVVLHHDIALRIKELNESLDDIAVDKERSLLANHGFIRFTSDVLNVHIQIMNQLAAKQDYEIEKLNERDCEPFRWCFCNSGLSSQGLSTHGRLVSLADAPQSKE
ncbi:hypothetical protein EZV62_003918 [Acer yangbiense]|uniref:Rx N-terminal domain-containing protein n=1 Tax=Acer yangbiense TaxID=1000413 RepID=A0A5C7IIB2_9ROSI|nr:hypothetical protein EZV62_003918 [Acer yangbiense]